MPESPEACSLRFSRGLTVTMICIAAVKIWLAKALPLTVLADSDEKTFLLQTQGLLSGQWFGKYTIVTLVKMPFYSMFLAASFLLGMPVLVAQQVLYVVACAVLLVALRPALAGWRAFQFALLYALLVFNPMTCLGEQRLLRNHVYASLGVLLVAGVLGVLVRIDRDRKAAVKWQVLFTLALTAQWLTREESVWVVPFLFIYTVCVLWKVWRISPIRWSRTIAFVAAPYCVVALAVFAVASLNAQYYGVFVTNEQQSKEMNDAIGAIHAVTPMTYRDRYDVVTKETRERIYVVSPAFSKLRDSLEGDVGRQWAEPTCNEDKVCTNNDVGWGWFTWELRHAAMIAGYQDNAAKAAQFYGQIAKDIRTACEDGRLSCQPPRSTTMPEWKNAYLREFLARYWSTVKYVVSFDGYKLSRRPNEGSSELLSEYTELADEPVNSSASGLQVAGWAISTKSPVEFSVRDEKGDDVQFAVEREPRPDVVAFSQKIGYGQSVDLNSGFKLRVSCPSTCYLYAKGGNHPTAWEKVMQLKLGNSGSNLPATAPPAARTRDPYLAAMQTGDTIIYLDSVTSAGDAGPRLQSRLDMFKFSILRTVATMYHRLNPLAIVVASALLAAGWLLCGMRRSIPDWIICVSLTLLLILNRLTMMVLVDVLAVRGISQYNEYEQYVYPLLLIYAGVTICNLPQATLSWERSRKP